MEKPPRRKFRQETVIHSYITRPLSLEIIRLIWNTPITPNHITIFRLLLNIIAIYLFLKANFFNILIGFILFQVNELLDSVDGMLARLKNIKSGFGVWMEQVFDSILSDGTGFFGFVLTYSAYKITGNINYFIFLFFAVLFSKLFLTYIKAFNLSKNEDNIHKKYGDDYLPIIGCGFLRCIRNLYITMLTWQNQFQLFGLLLLIPCYKYCNFDLFYYVSIFVLLLNIPPVVYSIYLAYKKVVVNDYS